MKFLRKIAPFLVAGMFLGSTALAADLGTWKTDAKGDIYVGENAASQYDGAAAINIASALGLVIPVAGSVVAGAVIDSITEDAIGLETVLDAEFGTPFEDNDLESLQDTVIEMDDEDISVHDAIILDAATPSIETSTSSRDDYGADPVIEVGVGALSYHYYFDEAYTSADIDDASPLTIEFMGKSLMITDIDEANDEITAQVGDEFFVKEGETMTVGGHTIVLDTVAEGGPVYVFVDGTGKSIAEGATVKFGTGDDAVRVRCKDTLYSEKKDSKAILIIGEYALQTYANGDEYIIPCSTPESEDCSEDDPDWIWEIDLTNPGAADDFIGVTNDFSWNELDEPVLGIGDSMFMPGNFISMTFDSLAVDDFAKYTITFDDTYDLGVDGADAGADTDDENVFVIKAVGQSNEGMTINNHDTDEIILWYDGVNVQGYYVDDDNDVQVDGLGVDAAIVFTFDYDESEIDAAIVAEDDCDTTDGFTLVIDTDDDGIDGDDLELCTEDTAATEYVGFMNNGASDPEDAYFGATPIGENDKDTLFSYGIVMLDPENGFEDDEVTVNIPSDVQEATVTIATHEVGGTTTTTTGGWMPKTDADTIVQGTPLISVGGPAINKVSADLLGLPYPTYGTDAAWISATGVDALGKGIIKIIDSSTVNGAVAMLVAGFEGSDTLTLSTILKEGTPALSGKEALINTAGKTLITA